MGLLGFVQHLSPGYQMLAFAVVAARKDFVMVDRKMMAELVAAAVGRKNSVQIDRRLLVEIVEVVRKEMVLVRRRLLTVHAAAEVGQVELVREDSIVVQKELQRHFVPAD